VTESAMEKLLQI